MHVPPFLQSDWRHPVWDTGFQWFELPMLPGSFLSCGRRKWAWVWGQLCTKVAPAYEGSVKEHFVSMYYWGYMSLEVKGWLGLLLPPCLLITLGARVGEPPPNPLGEDNSPGPWQRTEAVGKGSPAHPDDTRGAALQPRWKTGSH